MITGALSNAVEIGLIDAITGGTNAIAQPTAWFLALSTANPTDDASGLSEIVGNGYARVDVADWETANNRGTANTNAVTFNAATADWVDGSANSTITHWALFNHITNSAAADMIAYGDFNEPPTVSNGETYEIEARTLQLQFQPGNFTTPFANRLMDHLFGGTAYTAGLLWYYLSTSDPGDTAANLIEPAAGAGYTRLAEAGAALGDAVSVGNVSRSTNSAIATFPNASASWGRISHCGLASAATVNDIGSILTHAPIDVATTIDTSNQPAQFPVGSYKLEID